MHEQLHDYVHAYMYTGGYPPAGSYADLPQHARHCVRRVCETKAQNICDVLKRRYGMGSVDSHSLNIACSTSNDMAPHTEQSRVIKIDQLSSDSLKRLCAAFEVWGLLPSAPHNLRKPANNAYLLDGLQHPKANKLIQHSSSGPRLDLHVFTVKELKVLARHLDTPYDSSDRKQVIVDNLFDKLQGDFLSCSHAMLRRGLQQLTEVVLLSRCKKMIAFSLQLDTLRFSKLAAAVPNKQAQPVQPALRRPSIASRQAVGFGNSGGYGSQQHSLLAREDKSASQHSRDYTTAASVGLTQLTTRVHDCQFALTTCLSVYGDLAAGNSLHLPSACLVHVRSTH